MAKKVKKCILCTIVGLICSSCVARKITYPNLEGAWQPPGVIGYRIEINDTTLSLFWNGKKIHTTSFEILENGSDQKFVLENNQVKTNHSQFTIETIIHKSDVLEMDIHYEFAGHEIVNMEKTTDSIYGSGEIITDKVKTKLQGIWLDEENNYQIIIKDNQLTIGPLDEKGETIEFIVIQTKDEKPNGTFTIKSKESSIVGINNYLSELMYEDGKLTCDLLVLDANATELIFIKQ